MFKNAKIYSIAFPATGIDQAELEEKMQAARFVPTGKTQELSVGWTPPRGNAHDAMLESTGWHGITRLAIETRSVPADAIKKYVDEAVAKIEQETGRNPGKKERRDLKADAALALLPYAFPKRAEVGVWFDIMTGRLVLDTASQSRADSALTALVQAMPVGTVIATADIKMPPAALMRDWLLHKEAAGPFYLGRACVLEDSGEIASKVKYVDHALEINEVVEHIKHGKTPTELALTFGDRVAFTLTDSLTLKGIELLDGVALTKADAKEQAGAFDADVAIFTGEMTALLGALFAELNGGAQ